MAIDRALPPRLGAAARARVTASSGSRVGDQIEAFSWALLPRQVQSAAES